MKTSTVLITCTIFLFTLVNVYGQEKSCKDSVSDLTKRQLKRVAECTTKLKFKNGKEKNERKVCVMRCVFELEEVLSPDGTADPVGTMVFVEKNLPAAVTEKARTIIMGCFEVTAGLIPDEVSCKSYDPLVKCAMNALGQFCT